MSEPHLLSPKGFRAAGVYGGIKSRPLPDVGLLVCDAPALATAAVLFTANRVVAAPIIVGRRHAAAGRLRAVVVNSGNANACTGKQGEKDAMEMCRVAAGCIGAAPKQILPGSTGIIGHLLPMNRVVPAIAEAAAHLGDTEEHSRLFADAILTTDTCRKSAAASFKLNRQEVRLAGVCKGSGMIGPRLGPPHATMLAYLTTDVAAPAPLLRKLLTQSADESFNAVTVDDQASTNDTLCLLASGASGAKINTPAGLKSFSAALKEVCQSLAKQIAADGEGATKLVTIKISGAANAAAARIIARAIAVSPLVKCAMNGNDPNWGRIVCAAGMAGVPFDPKRCVLKLAGTMVFQRGRPAPFEPAAVSAALAQREVSVELNCRQGTGTATFWTCDLSKDYVAINADYHT